MIDCDYCGMFFHLNCHITSFTNTFVSGKNKCMKCLEVEKASTDISIKDKRLGEYQIFFLKEKQKQMNREEEVTMINRFHSHEEKQEAGSFSMVLPIKLPTKVITEKITEEKDGFNIDYCLICEEFENLIYCDYCPRSFHCKCIEAKMEDISTYSLWKCKLCENNENNLSDDIMEGEESNDVIHASFAPFMKLIPKHDKNLLNLTKIHEMLIFLLNYHFGYIFANPVEIHNYQKVIMDPKDLGTIVLHLLNGNYYRNALLIFLKYNESRDASNEQSKEFPNTVLDEVILCVVKDIEKVWRNCLQFNPKGSVLYRIGQVMRDKNRRICRNSFYKDLSLYTKSGIDEYIKECNEAEELFQVTASLNNLGPNSISNESKKNYKRKTKQIDKKRNEKLKGKEKKTMAAQKKSTTGLTSMKFSLAHDTKYKQTTYIPDKNTNHYKLDQSIKACNVKQQKDDYNVDYCLICDETGDLICCDFCPRAFHCECIGLKINDLPTSRWQCTMCKQKGRIMPDDVVKGKKSFKVISKAFSTLVISCPGSGKQLEILSKIYEMVQNLLKYDFGSYFAEPIKLRSYCQAIIDPKDLGTISKNILKGVYCQKILIRLSEKDELAESTSEKECNKVTTQTAFDEVILTVLRDVEKV